MKKLLFPLQANPDNLHFASGSLSSIYRALECEFELVPIGPFRLSRNSFHGALNRLNSYGLFPLRFAADHSWRVVREYSKQIQPFADTLEHDAIFSTSTLMVANVVSSKPIFTYTDFSIASALDYYPSWMNVSSASRREAMEVENRGLRQCARVFLASDWACDAAAAAFDLPRENLVAIARGANLSSGLGVAGICELVDRRIASERKDCLFVGVDWSRKGGDIAHAVVKGLRGAGIQATLTVVGCQPPRDVSRNEYVRVFPFLSKESASELAQLRALFESAFLFILPTQAEAMGIVFAEAASFGLPSIAYSTGGISAAVASGETGLLFKLSAGIDEMVESILRLVAEPRGYRAMSVAAFEKYESELNWTAIGARIGRELRKIL